jgi:hypothetical protein
LPEQFLVFFGQFIPIPQQLSDLGALASEHFFLIVAQGSFDSAKPSVCILSMGNARDRSNTSGDFRATGCSFFRDNNWRTASQGFLYHKRKSFTMTGQNQQVG